VGKTIVAAALAAALVHRGVRTGVLKPAETGVAAPKPGGNVTGTVSFIIVLFFPVAGVLAVMVKVPGVFVVAGLQ